MCVCVWMRGEGEGEGDTHGVLKKKTKGQITIEKCIKYEKKNNTLTLKNLILVSMYALILHL